MQRILIFNVNWLGDVICSTPAIRAIKKMYPDSYLACLVVPGCRPALETNPHIDEVIDFDEHGRHKSLLGKLKLIEELRSRKFDSVYILHRSFSRALMMVWAGIPRRIGYATKNRGWILSCKLKEPDGKKHKVDYFLDLVKAGQNNKIGAGAEQYELKLGNFSEDDYEFVVPAAVIEQSGKILASCGLKDSKIKFAVLNPGGNWLPKRWPAQNFARLGDMIADKTGMAVVITGAQKDIALAWEIAGQMKTAPVIVCGQTDIKTLAGILKSAAVVVTADSGPMHLAVAVGARVIALFGPTSAALTGPRGRGDYTVIHKDIGCEVPCYSQACDDFRCMKAITPEEIMEVL